MLFNLGEPGAGGFELCKWAGCAVQHGAVGEGVELGEELLLALLQLRAPRATRHHVHVSYVQLVHGSLERVQRAYGAAVGQHTDASVQTSTVL